MKSDDNGQSSPTSIFEFSKSISFLTLFGILAYIHAYIRTDSVTKYFLKKHFTEIDLGYDIDQFSEDFYNEIRGFYQLSLLLLLDLCIYSFLFTFYWVGNPDSNYFLDEKYNTFIACGFYIIMCAFLFHFDFRYVLQKSKSGLLGKFRWKHEWNILKRATARLFSLLSYFP
jgi:hypothetical protein